MSSGVVVVGAINVDLVVVAERLPGPGETVVGPRVLRVGGGKGANAAVAARAAGATTLLVGAVGDDGDGSFALDDLRARGVDVAAVTTVRDEATGTALIVVDRRGENQIAVGLGANAAVSAAAVRAAVAGRDAACVLVSTEIPGPCVVAAVEAARDAGLLCVLNPAPVIPEVLDLLDAGIVLTPNLGEARDLAGLLALSTDSPADIATALAARTRRPVVVTLGADGTVVADGTQTVHRPAEAVRGIVDTTGAGDCFNGALVAALATGAELPDAVAAANRAAARSVQWPGARAPLT